MFLHQHTQACTEQLLHGLRLHALGSSASTEAASTHCDTLRRFGVVSLQDLCDQCAAAKALFDNAADVLGYDLLKVCSEGVRQNRSPVS